MSERFDVMSWKERVAAWWQQAAADLQGTAARLGVKTAYGLLAASAWLPLLDAYGQDPGRAVAVLAAILSGVGTNLLSNLVQGTYDKTTAPHQVEQEATKQPDMRAEHRQIVEALDVLHAARTALGGEWASFYQELRRQDERLGGVLRIDTGGGAYVGGGVDTGGGTFVGRDQIVVGDKWQVILGDQYVGLSPRDVPPEDLMRAYYRALADECRRLPLGVVRAEFFRLVSEHQVALDDVYVDLDVVSPPRDEGEDHRAWGLRLARGEGGERVPLLDALVHPRARQAVLLGDPGSGKTTFVDYVAHLLAESAISGSEAPLPQPLRGLLPVRLVLRAAASCLPVGAGRGTAAMLWDVFQADLVARLGQAAADVLLPYLQRRLLRGGGLFLLDGLDEVPEAGRRRRCLLEAIHDLAASLPAGARILLTARPYAYADPLWRMPDFVVLALAPFNEAQVSRFVDRWYDAVRPAMGWDTLTARQRAEQLATALRERTYLADLASRPLLLTLTAALHASGGQLPEDRADLYEESVKLLLSRWQRGREIRDASGRPVLEPGIERALGLGDAAIRAALERLAFQAHQRQGGQARQEDVPADIPLGDVLAAFAPLLPDDCHPGVLLSYLEDRAGLLVGRREEVYAFPHRSFQEYLAACHLANTEREFAERLRELAWEDLTWWREVFLLGVGKKRQGGLGDAVNVVNTLVPASVSEVDPVTEVHWRAAALAGEALLELRRSSTPPGGRTMGLSLGACGAGWRLCSRRRACSRQGTALARATCWADWAIPVPAWGCARMACRTLPGARCLLVRSRWAAPATMPRPTTTKDRGTHCTCPRSTSAATRSPTPSTGRL
jgi:hypothetical protein